jgi:hypothetical protein
MAESSYLATVSADAVRPGSPAARLVDASHDRSRRGRGDLAILITLVPGATVPDTILAELLDKVEFTFYDTLGSLTRALRAALLEANGALYQYNLKAASGEQILVGINCALVRPDELYLAQMGPALTVIAGPGRIERFPQASVWTSGATPGSYEIAQEPPCGLRLETEPVYGHASRSPDDTLYFLSPSAGPLIEGVNLGHPASMATLVGALQSSENPGGLVLLAVGAIAGARPETEPAEQSAVRHRDAVAEPVAEPPAAATPVAQRPVDRPVPIAAAEPPAAAPTAPAQRPFSPSPVAAEPASAPPIAREATPTASVATTLPTPPWAETGQPKQDEDDDEVWDEEQEEDSWTQQRSASTFRPPQIDLTAFVAGLRRTTDKLRRQTARALDRTLPAKMPERPTTATPSGQPMPLSGKALVAIAMVIPLVMVFIVVMMRVQYDRIRRDQFSSVQSLALSQYDAALTSDNMTYRRQGLYDALATSEEGLSISPSDESLGSLKRRILHELDSVDQIERLYTFWRLTPLNDVAASPFDSSRIVLQGIDVYLLNRGSDRLYRFLLNDVGDALQSVDTAAPLLTKGQNLGGAVLGDLVDITWMQAAGDRTRDSFVVLDRSGSLLVYDPQQGVELLPVANSDTWLKPQAIGAYFGNLYVLDPLLGRILKYVPTDNAYTTPPSDYVNPNLYVDLTGAVDMAIDGNVYVLFADGKVAKFFQGDAMPFDIVGLPSPMKSPSVISVSGEQEPDADGYVYVADTGNERILQFTKSGQFVRQFRDKQGEDHLKHLQGLYVDEVTGRMFLVSSEALWLARVPLLNE